MPKKLTVKEKIANANRRKTSYIRLQMIYEELIEEFKDKDKVFRIMELILDKARVVAGWGFYGNLYYYRNMFNGQFKEDYFLEHKIADDL